MSYEMPGHSAGTPGGMIPGHHAPQMMHPAQNAPQQSGVLFCNKHDSVINTFCMTHQVPLCQTCVPEHLHLYNQSHANAPYLQQQRQIQCELMPIERAIAESLMRIQQGLTSVQDFIEFKKQLKDFPDESSLQMYLQQNQIFENAYSMAHRHFISLQNMPDGQRELHLSQINQSFNEEYRRLCVAKTTIENLYQRIASQNPNVQQMPSTAATSQSNQQNASVPTQARQSATSGGRFPGNEDQRHPNGSQQPDNHLNQQNPSMYMDILNQRGATPNQQQQQHNMTSQGSSANPGQHSSSSHGQQQQAAPPTLPSLSNQQHGQAATKQAPQLSSSQQMGFPNYDAQLNQAARQQQPSTMNQSSNAAAANSTTQVQSQAQAQNNNQPDLNQQMGASYQGAFPAPGRNNHTTPNSLPANQQHGQGNQGARLGQPANSSGPPYQEVGGQNQTSQYQANRSNHRGLRLTVRIDLEVQQLNFEVEVDPNQSLKQLQQNIKEDVARLEPASCQKSSFERMMIYVSDVAGEPTQEDLANHYELIPQQSWSGSLIECGLREGYVLYFTNRPMPRSNTTAFPQANGAGGREASHPREGSGSNVAVPLGSPKLPPVNQITGSGVDPMAVPAIPSNSVAGNTAFTPHNKEGKGNSSILVNDKQKSIGQNKNGTNGNNGVQKMSSTIRAGKVELDVEGNIKRQQSAIANNTGVPLAAQISVGNISTGRAAERGKRQPIKKEKKQQTIYFRLFKKKNSNQADESSDHQAAQGDNENDGEGQENKTEKIDENEDQSKLAQQNQPDEEQKQKTNSEQNKKSAQVEEDYTRCAQIGERAKVKQLKKAILEELQLQDMCEARIYISDRTNVEAVPCEDNLVVRDLNIDKVEVEIYLQVHVSVQGKGSSYVKQIEVSPSEPMDVIRSRVPFYKMFAQRRYTLHVDKSNGNKDSAADIDIIDEAILSTTTWRDQGVKNGAKLVMREPSRGLAARGRPAISYEQAQEQLGIDQDEENQAMGEEFEHEGEEGHFFGEGGEDEMVEMMGAEGGEEEMMEMMGAEAGEEEMAEEGAEEAENDE